MALKERLAGWARRLKAETVVLAVAVRHPRVPWPAKLFGAVVIAYALSPIDLIPDFIPVLGYLDDLLLVPLGLWLTLKLIPAEVLAEVRTEAERLDASSLPKSRGAAIAIVLIWVLAALIVGRWLYRLLSA
ncbi:MAG TPA: DUF1232 domain-containing protein [Hyphomicrobiaceae bacterium]|nr:DUF1232 domain-containing protein [Hyphomicrobiaceae bacterium]